MTAADTPDEQADDGRAVDAVGGLRAAAEMLRDTAGAVDGWYTAKAWATTAPMSVPIEKTDAAYIAMLQPPVALALADWLENEAALIASQLEYPALHTRPNFGRIAHMEALTNAILGTTS